MITAGRLREVLNYNPETGLFAWRVSYKRIKIGQAPNYIDPHGYCQIRVDGRLYSAHRLAWLHVHGKFPSGFLDHANGVRTDNRLSNLREATNSQNLQNARRRSNNTSGFKGVSFNKKLKKWQGTIRVKGKSTYLGVYETVAEAHQAYCAAARKHFGEFARVN